MEEDFTEVEQYIANYLKAIEKGVGEHYVHGDIQFDIATIKTKTKEGKISFKVVEGGRNHTKEEYSRTKFNVGLRRKGGGIPSGGV
ncbi:MAG: hypothetical protein MUO73_06755 [Thermoplasmata archaeon]|nr:hypothetical protein [Thermoplasmata archaeon]